MRAVPRFLRLCEYAFKGEVAESFSRGRVAFCNAERVEIKCRELSQNAFFARKKAFFFFGRNKRRFAKASKTP